MKINDVTIADLKKYANVTHAEDDALFTAILTACKAHIKNYTGLTTEMLNTKEDLTMCLYVLANELYDNRTYIVENEKVNAVVRSILDSHSINLLG